MKILIAGGTGLLGKALIETKSQDKDILATYVGDYDIKDDAAARYRKIDIRDKNGYKDLFGGFKPDVVIHAAGIGSPDFAEQNKEISWEINVGGTKNLLSCAAESGSKFIFISSNGIYDGGHAPYSEEDEAHPINYYGVVKLAGEEIVRGSGLTCAILRPILMYGWNHAFERNNIVTVALHKFKNHKTIHAYRDVVINPLFAPQCAEAIWKVIEKEQYETFNIGGKDRLSIYEFLRHVADVFAADPKLVAPVEQGFFQELVRRPADTSYDTGKMEKVLGIRPLPVDAGLRIMKEREIHA